MEEMSTNMLRMEVIEIQTNLEDLLILNKFYKEIEIIMKIKNASPFTNKII